MLEKLKQYWVSIASFIGVVVGFLIFLLFRKNNKIEALKAKIQLATTEKEADMIEVEIKHLQQNKNMLQQEHKELDKTLDDLEIRREEIKLEVSELKNPQEIADYWEKN